MISKSFFNNNNNENKNFLRRRRIMMVDDEPDVNYTFENVLDDNGFLVDSFINPILALKRD